MSLSWNPTTHGLPLIIVVASNASSLDSIRRVDQYQISIISAQVISLQSSDLEQALE